MLKCKLRCGCKKTKNRFLSITLTRIPDQLPSLKTTDCEGTHCCDYTLIGPDLMNGWLLDSSRTEGLSCYAVHPCHVAMCLWKKKTDRFLCTSTSCPLSPSSFILKFYKALFFFWWFKIVCKAAMHVLYGPNSLQIGKWSCVSQPRHCSCDGEA